MTELSLGVVIPCHDNSWQLHGALTSLTNQTVRPDQIVIVDDNSATGESRRLRSLCAAFSAAYHRLPSPRDNVEALGRRSHARNAGTTRLTSDIVLYLDGDMLAGPRYVEEIKRYHALLDKVYLRGQRCSISAALQSRGMATCLHEIAHRQGAGEASPVGYMPSPKNWPWQAAHGAACYDRWEWCASNNLSLMTEYAIAIGWDEHFFGWGEEDIDFSFRLYEHGLTPLYVTGDNAVAYHLDHEIDRARNALTLRANARYLLNKFPQIAESRRQAVRAFRHRRRRLEDWTRVEDGAAGGGERSNFPKTGCSPL